MIFRIDAFATPYTYDISSVRSFEAEDHEFITGMMNDPDWFVEHISTTELSEWLDDQETEIHMIAMDAFSDYKRVILFVSAEDDDTAKAIAEQCMDESYLNLA